VQPEQSQPADAYGAFCGPINENSARDLIYAMTTATARGQNVHLLFQSSGGSVGEGICLYNFFRTLPIELTIYNVGSVNSAAVIAYLGAKRRITSARAVFMLHRTFAKAGETVPYMMIPGITKNLAMSDEHTESILRENITLPESMNWSDLDRYDFYFSGAEAVQIGLAHEIGDFAPPAGTSVYHFFSNHPEPKSK
jgi:ATP-dependent protease ClpP protease subunit